MRTRMDKAGRVVIPKRLRDELGLAAGTSFEVERADGHLELHRRGPKVIVAEHTDGRPYLTTTEPVPPMTDDELFGLIDESREWPHKY